MILSANVVSWFSYPLVDLEIVGGNELGRNGAFFGFFFGIHDDIDFAAFSSNNF